MSKICPKCDTDLPEQAFSKDRTKPDGLCHYCKICRKDVRKNPRFRRLKITADFYGNISCQKCGETKPATEFYLTRTKIRECFCKACRHQEHVAWKTANPGLMNTYTAKWRIRNPEKQSAAQTNWRSAYPERAKASTNNWRATHPDNVATTRATRYARIRNAVIHEAVSLVILYARDKGICGICHTHVPRKEASRDHIIPLSKGGDHSYANAVLAHLKCNSRKGNRLVTQQMRLF